MTFLRVFVRCTWAEKSRSRPGNFLVLSWEIGLKTRPYAYTTGVICGTVLRPRALVCCSVSSVLERSRIDIRLNSSCTWSLSPLSHTAINRGPATDQWVSVRVWVLVLLHSSLPIVLFNSIYNSSDDRDITIDVISAVLVRTVQLFIHSVDRPKTILFKTHRTQLNQLYYTSRSLRLGQ